MRIPGSGCKVGVQRGCGGGDGDWTEFAMTRPVWHWH